MTSRVEGDPLDDAWRSRTGRSPLVTIDLGPLRPQEAEILAGAYFMAHAELARRCVERAAGNPCSSSSSCAMPRRVPSRACRARCRAWCRPAWTGSTRPTSWRCRRRRFSASGSIRYVGRALRATGYDAGGLVRHRLVRPHGGGALLFAHALIRMASTTCCSRVGGGSCIGGRRLVRRARSGAPRRAPGPGGGPRGAPGLPGGGARPGGGVPHGGCAGAGRARRRPRPRAGGRLRPDLLPRGGPARSRPDRGINERVPTRP